MRDKSKSAKLAKRRRSARRELPPVRVTPRIDGGETYERILAAAGKLLGDVGFERLTTNAIVAQAGLTPPALYRYFNDKYDVVEVLARRLLQRQNDAYATWLMQNGTWEVLENPVEFLKEWYRLAAELITRDPSALWVMRALRAMPNLAHIRLESQRETTDRLFEFYRRLKPDEDPKRLWARLRIRVEIGWVVDELALEENRVPHHILFSEVARLFDPAFEKPSKSPGALARRR